MTMTVWNIFRRKGFLTGTVAIHGLPTHKAYSASIALFPVGHIGSAPPWTDKPTLDQYTDEVQIKDASAPEEQPLRFRLRRPAGFYYCDIGVIVYIDRRGKSYAQVERFFSMTSPCCILPVVEQRLDFTVNWPAMPVEELHEYGIVHPRNF